jgi:uncharacterized membrane protein YkoI
MHAHHTITTLLMAVVMTAATAVHAQEMIERGQREAYYVQSGGSVSLDAAVQMAQSRFNARVVKAETVGSGNRRVHQIRLLNAQGKVWTVRVDAQTGQMF